MKGLSGIVAVLVIVGALAGVFLIAPQMGVNLFSAAPGGSGTEEKPIFIESSCDDDGLVRLVAAYVDKLADDAASLSTADSWLYEVSADGSQSVILNQADETSGTFGTYNEVGTNVLVCGKQYELWLGDEDENPLVSTGVFTASGSEKRVTVNGNVIGGETYSGFEQGTLESTLNVTMGSGATTTSIKLEYSSSTADQGHEAKDGFLFVSNYNDTAVLKFEHVGVSDFNGKVTSNNNPIRSVSCPDVVGNLISTTDDYVNRCWVLPVTSVADGGSFDVTMYLALESGVNPAVGSGCDGGTITQCALRATILDENGFQNTEKPPGYPIEYGYSGDDEDNIGEPTTTTIVINLA